MKDIANYILGESHEGLKLKRFYRLKRKVADKKRLRKLEQDLLKPKALNVYLGKIPTKGPLVERTVKLVFSSLEDVKLFEKWVTVNHYIEKNSRDLKMVLEFLECLERGSLDYVKKEEKIYFVDDRGDRYPL